MPDPEIVIINGRNPVYGGSQGNAVAITPDVNRLPGGTPVPFPNLAPNRLVGQNRSQFTFIRDFPIGLQNTEVGPFSNPAHPGLARGILTNRYRLQANPSSWSPNVFIEGRGVVRHGDSSFNNNFNTMGRFVIGEDGKIQIDTEWEEKRKCTLVKVFGIGAEGRKLGWPDKRAWHAGRNFGEANYLEVLDDETVILRTLRLDLTKPDAPGHPQCTKNHSHWEVTYTTYPARRKHVEKYSGDVCVVNTKKALDEALRELKNMIDGGKKWVALNLTGVEPGMLKLQEDSMKEYARQLPWSDKVQNTFGFLDSNPVTVESLSTDVHQWGGGIGGHYEKVEVYKHTSTSRNVGLNVMSNFGAILKILLWAYSAPSISVNAMACAGSRWVQMMVYPAEPYTFKFSMASENEYSFNDGKGEEGKKDADLDKVLKVIKKARVASDLAAKIFSLGGGNLDVTIAHGLELEVAIQYKRCTEMRKELWGAFLSTPASVGSDWTIKLKCERLVGATSEIKFSLFKLIPFIGPVAEKAFDAFGLRCEFYFGVEISAWIEGEFGMDHYKKMKNTKVTATFRIRPYGGARVGYFPKSKVPKTSNAGRVDNAAAGLIAEVDFPVTAQMVFSISEEPGEILIMEPNFELKLGFFAVVKAWKIFQWEFVPHTYPESLTVALPQKGQEQKFVLIAGAQ